MCLWLIFICLLLVLNCCNYARFVCFNVVCVLLFVLLLGFAFGCIAWSVKWWVWQFVFLGFCNFLVVRLSFVLLVLMFALMFVLIICVFVGVLLFGAPLV